MGDVQVGDRLVSPLGGSSNKVIAVSPVEIVPTYRIGFSDGSSIEASGDHQWKIRRWNEPPLLGGTTKAIKLEVELGNDIYIPRYAPDAANKFESKQVTYVSVEAPQPMRCLQVECPSGLYCITEDWTITHNSALARFAAIIFSLQIPGLQSYLFRRTYPELQATPSYLRKDVCSS